MAYSAAVRPCLLAAAAGLWLAGCGARAPVPAATPAPAEALPAPRVDPERRPPQPITTVRQGGLLLDAEGWLGRGRGDGVELTQPGTAVRVRIRDGLRSELDEVFGGRLAWSGDGPYGPLASLQAGAVWTASRPLPDGALAVAWFLDCGVLVEAEVGPERFEAAWTALRSLLATARWENEP